MAVAAPSIGKQSGFQLSAKGQENAAGFLFILPALIIIVTFIFFPLLSAFLISFTNWNGLQPPAEAQNVGLRNYERIFGLDGTTVVRDEFFVAIKNTFYYTLGVVPTQTVLALILAFIVNQQFLRFRGFFRVAFYFPSITSSIVIATIFLWLFNRNGVINGVIGGVASALGLEYSPVTWINDANGIIHNFLRLFGLTLRTAPAWMTETNILGQTVWQWISGPSVTMLAIMLLAIWTTTGTMMLIFLAALQDIPRQLYEAASVDGATRLQQFFLITVPMLRPTTFFRADHRLDRLLPSLRSDLRDLARQSCRHDQDHRLDRLPQPARLTSRTRRGARLCLVRDHRSFHHLPAALGRQDCAAIARGAAENVYECSSSTELRRAWLRAAA
jgi:multiple sugar transport system permease protein